MILALDSGSVRATSQRAGVQGQEGEARLDRADAALLEGGAEGLDGVPEFGVGHGSKRLASFPGGPVGNAVEFGFLSVLAQRVVDQAWRRGHDIENVFSIARERSVKLSRWCWEHAMSDQRRLARASRINKFEGRRRNLGIGGHLVAAESRLN